MTPVPRPRANRPEPALSAERVAAYLARIGAEPPQAPDLAGLRGLQRAHLEAVPFENLSIHLNEPISLETDALFRKIVVNGRGGFCYELNGLFAELLTALGHRVELLSARVFGDGAAGPPFDHLALRVTLDDAPWLVDVGFGRFAQAPLSLADRREQADPDGPYLVTPAPGGHGELDVSRAGVPQYRLDPRPYALRDFGPTCWWQRTSPESSFTRSLTCSRLTRDGGRVTLNGDRLIETAPDGTRRERRVDDQLAAYTEHFGVDLPRIPSVRPGQPGSLPVC